MDDNVSFDAIVNGTAPAETGTTTPEITSDKPIQDRDDQGRFAADLPVTDKAAQAAIEGGTQAAPAAEPSGSVPHEALHASRVKEQAARERAEKAERELAELRNPAKPSEPAKPKASIWTNPDDFVAEQIAPVQQSLTQQKFEISRLMAEDKLGEDVVKAADDALGELMKANDPAVLVVQQRVMKSRHPYAELVKWHESHKAMSEIGNDPVAYRSKLEADIRAQIAAEANGGQPAPSATVSSSTKPATHFPKSLNSISGGGNPAGADDGSDAGMFANITSGRR